MAGPKELYRNNGKYPHKAGEQATAYKHGFYSLRKAINRKIDKRTVAGRAIMRWQQDLIADLGSDVSVQQQALIELCAKNKLLLDSIDGWLFSQKSLVMNHKKALIPVVKERQAIADALAKYLSMLGLERRAKPVSLDEYVKQKYGKQEDD